MVETFPGYGARSARSWPQGWRRLDASSGYSNVDWLLVDALLGERATVDGQRVLVLGEAPSKTLCALIPTECRCAEARLPDGPVDSETADLVLVPNPTPASLDRVVAQAARALRAHGRLVMTLPPLRCVGQDFAVRATRTLVAAGFEPPAEDEVRGMRRLSTRLGERRATPPASRRLTLVPTRTGLA